MEQEGIITAAHNVTPHIYSFRSLDPKVPVSLPYLISSDSGVIAAGAAYIYNVVRFAFVVFLYILLLYVISRAC